MRLYIIRHADPDYDNDTITEAGHREAEALAERLRQEGINHIYCSPLNRAIHTMQYTSELLGIRPVIVPWLTELNGWHVESAPGIMTPSWDVHGESIRAEQYNANEKWDNRAPFKGYGLYAKWEAIRRGSDEFMESIGYEREKGIYRIVSPNTDRIAVFCHHGLGTTWLAHLLELPLPLVWSGFWMAPSSVTTVLMDERSTRYAVPRCLGFGDVSHLYHSRLPVSPQGIKANYD